MLARGTDVRADNFTSHVKQQRFCRGKRGRTLCVDTDQVWKRHRTLAADHGLPMSLDCEAPLIPLDRLADARVPPMAPCSEVTVGCPPPLVSPRDHASLHSERMAQMRPSHPGAPRGVQTGALDHSCPFCRNNVGAECIMCEHYRFGAASCKAVQGTCGHWIHRCCARRLLPARDCPHCTARGAFLGVDGL
jgi:hypothetical protein